MASRPPSLQPCGCVVAPGARCPHMIKRDQERRARHEATRPSARQRGYTRDWEKASKRFLARPENALCACGCGREADMVDHRIAHKGDQRLFWAETNWQPFNSICNRRKAVREEGAFGRPMVDQGVRGVKNPQTGRDRTGVPSSQLSASKKRICSDGT